MTEQTVVLVWDENPDAVKFYQVPSHKKICSKMRAAQGQMINEWVEQHGKKYLVDGVATGSIVAVIHCGFFM